MRRTLTLLDRFLTPAVGVWVTAGLLLGLAVPPIQGLETPKIAFFHVPVAVAMILAFMVAAGYGVAWLKTRRVRFDALSFAFAETGAIFGIIAMATGLIFARTNWNVYWAGDPQQVGVLATLLTYGALFALRGAVEDDDRRRDLWAVYAIFGCIVAVFGSAIYRRLLPVNATLHPRNTLFESDPLITFALWFNVAGYALLMVQIARVRARLMMVSERRQARAIEQLESEVATGETVWIR